MASKKTKNTTPLKSVRIDDLQTISPITENQKKTFDAFKQGKELILHGVAGTGKSFISLYLALEQVLDPSTEYDDIFIVRSTVPTRDMGFLPGTEEEKVSIYEAPYRQICGELFSVRNAYDSLKAQGTIKFTSTSYVRGITINNSIVIVDELQNLTFHELDSVFTRVGQNTKIMFCGDYLQSDLQKSNDRSGVLDFMRVFKSMEETADIEFTTDDIVRSDIIRSYILAKLKLGVT